MKYYVIILTFILLIIIYNLYSLNTNKINNIVETYHESDITMTSLQNDISNSINNIDSAINNYENNNIIELNDKADIYNIKLNELENEWYGSSGSNGLNMGSKCALDKSIVLDNYDKYDNLTCDFEKKCTNSSDSEYPIIYSTLNGNPITIEECSRKCDNDGDNCLAFSYKDEPNDQECRLSSICTERNANSNDKFNLYIKKNLNYTQFPLTNYKIDYNKKCRSDIYNNKENTIRDSNKTLSECAKLCNNDVNCISFEYNPNDKLCSPKSVCYEHGCLESSTDSSTSPIDNCNTISLYSKKLLIPDNTKVPDYINCELCNNNNTVYNSNFLRLYETNDKNERSKLVYTNNISKIQSEINNDNILENIKYYKISNGNKVKLFKDYNFKGVSIWLDSTFDRQLISNIGDNELNNGLINEEEQTELQKFKSFKILSDSKSLEVKKDCQGYWDDCDYNINNQLVSKWITTQNETEGGKCENKNKEKLCNRDCVEILEWDISNCGCSDGDNLKHKKYIKAIPKSGKGNECIGEIEYSEKCTEKDNENNDLCECNNDYTPIKWSECNASGTKNLISGNLGSQSHCLNPKSCIWDVEGIYKSKYIVVGNDKFRYSIAFSNRKNDPNKIKPLILNLNKEYLSGTLHYSEEIDIGVFQENRDLIVFSSVFKTLNEKTKSYVIEKKYILNGNNIQPRKITLNNINDNKKYDMFLQS